MPEKGTFRFDDRGWETPPRFVSMLILDCRHAKPCATRRLGEAGSGCPGWEPYVIGGSYKLGACHAR